jgi:hypothetical protein
MRIRELWKRLTRTRYTRALEAEVARLRAENRALLNSILGIAGVPPIPVSTPDPAATTDQNEAARRASGAHREMENRAAASLASPHDGTHRPARNVSDAPAAVPTRRRSWQQIHRRLELESARKQSQRPSEGASIPAAARTTLQPE